MKTKFHELVIFEVGQKNPFLMHCVSDVIGWDGIRWRKDGIILLL